MADLLQRARDVVVVLEAVVQDDLPAVVAQRLDLDAQPGDLFIARNIAIKARIVEADEFETLGQRALLNFGHTIGHGIEAHGAFYCCAHCARASGESEVRDRV